MIIVQNRLSSFLLGRTYAAMCFLPFLFVNRGIDIREIPESLNHERIHARQQIEMVWLFFFIWYCAEYLVRLLIYRSHRMAYLNLSHEREAYDNASDPDYLIHRRPYAWVKYLRGQWHRKKSSNN